MRKLTKGDHAHELYAYKELEKRPEGRGKPRSEFSRTMAGGGAYTMALQMWWKVDAEQAAKQQQPNCSGWCGMHAAPPPAPPSCSPRPMRST
jgi:hypothetical protein